MAARGRVPAMGRWADLAALHLDQRLRRGTGDLEVLEVQEVHVGAGVDGAQPAVDREGLDRRLRAPALAGHHLVDVARADVLLGPLHRLRVALGAEVRAPLGRLGRQRADSRDRPGEALAHLGHGLGGARVALLQPVGGHVGDHRDLVAQMVEGHQQLGDHHGHLGHAQLVGVGLPHAGLDGAHQVVAEQAHGAAGERRQPVDRGERQAAQLLLHHRVGIALVAALPADHRAGAEAEERPAAEPLTLLGRLQQERRALAAELEVGRHRRLAVGDEGVAQRDQVALAGQLPRLLEGGAELEIRMRRCSAGRRPACAPAWVSDDAH